MAASSAMIAIMFACVLMIGVESNTLQSMSSYSKRTGDTKRAGMMVSLWY